MLQGAIFTAQVRKHNLRNGAQRFTSVIVTRNAHAIDIATNAYTLDLSVR
jgi:hypothetical protein